MDVAKSTWLHFLVSWGLICPGCYGTRGTNATLRTSSLGLTVASGGPALWVEEEAAKAEILVLAQRPTTEIPLTCMWKRKDISPDLASPCASGIPVLTRPSCTSMRNTLLTQPLLRRIAVSESRQASPWKRVKKGLFERLKKKLSKPPTGVKRQFALSNTSVTPIQKPLGIIASLLQKQVEDGLCPLSPLLGVMDPELREK